MECASKIGLILPVIPFSINGVVFSVYPFPLWLLREYVLFLIIITKLEVWTIGHCLGLGYENWYGLYVHILIYRDEMRQKV